MLSRDHRERCACERQYGGRSGEPDVSAHAMLAGGAGMRGAVMNSDTAAFRRFGPYALLQVSGAGGMGRVDVALTTRAGNLARLCVLKRMHPEMRSPEEERRFRREAKLALRLSHGAIARTLDVEEIDGELCLLQEFVHGTNLAQLEHRAASREPLPTPLSIHVAREVARALAYAHSFDGTGIVHRDVTPDNIML